MDKQDWLLLMTAQEDGNRSGGMLVQQSQNHHRLFFSGSELCGLRLIGVELTEEVVEQAVP